MANTPKNDTQKDSVDQTTKATDTPPAEVSQTANASPAVKAAQSAKEELVSMMASPLPMYGEIGHDATAIAAMLAGPLLRLPRYADIHSSVPLANELVDVAYSLANLIIDSRPGK